MRDGLRDYSDGKCANAVWLPIYHEGNRDHADGLRDQRSNFRRPAHSVDALARPEINLACSDAEPAHSVDALARPEINLHCSDAEPAHSVDALARPEINLPCSDAEISQSIAALARPEINLPCPGLGLQYSLKNFFINSPTNN